MVCLLVRDGAWFLPQFIEHHIRIGAAHILVIDNGSSDDTVEICRGYSNVTVLQNTMPAKHNEIGLRSVLSRTVAHGGWTLFADVDELIEPPLGTVLPQLTQYCLDHRYSCVIGQMLDRFSDADYVSIRNLDYRATVSRFKLFSLDQVDYFRYSLYNVDNLLYYVGGNSAADDRTTIKQGGVRKELFGEYPLLSKHSLVQNRPNIDLMNHPHFARNVVIADVELIIHHYKFAGDWIDRDRRSAVERHWEHGEDRQRVHATASTDDNFRFVVANPKEWRGSDDPELGRFIYVSDQFRSSVASASESSRPIGGRLAPAKVEQQRE